MVQMATQQVNVQIFEYSAWSCWRLNFNLDVVRRATIMRVNHIMQILSPVAASKLEIGAHTSIFPCHSQLVGKLDREIICIVF
jgi:hypothetical protein